MKRRENLWCRSLPGMVRILPVVMAFLAGLELCAAPAWQPETAYFQGEIDRVAAQGGGCVRVPKGVHPCGTLYLKSNVELHLEEGAVLLGGDKSDAYDDAIPERELYSYVNAHTNIGTRKAFVYAVNATNVSITGKGVIDCQGPKFFDHSTVLWERFWAKPPCMRPRMVVMMHCRDIRFQETTFKDCPVWTMWLRDCENVAVSKIRIVAEPKMINSDGIDFDGCRDVRVGDSFFSTGDDCLVLRAIRRGVPKGTSVVCENVVVSNCVLSTPCQGVRIGCPSDDTIRNAVFRDIVFTGNNAIFADQQPQYLEQNDRGRIRVSNILFENWDIRCSGHPISVAVEDGVTLKDFGYMTFRNIRVDSAQPIKVCGNGTTVVKDILLENVSGQIRSNPPVETRQTQGLRLKAVSVGSASADMRSSGTRFAEEVLKPCIASVGALSVGTAVADASLVPLQMTRPSAAYRNPDRIRYQTGPSVAVAPNGRLWVAIMTGGGWECNDNYVDLLTSGDGGESWSEPKLALDIDGPLRTFDPAMWTDPEGRVWLFWCQCYDFRAGRLVSPKSRLHRIVRRNAHKAVDVPS